MMIENEMEYRGSKSGLEYKTVKEQRVYGSWCFLKKYLRCTLMGFERNYQIKILSKQINKIRYYNTLSLRIKS
jgi:hypothetical protein